LILNFRFEKFALFDIAMSALDDIEFYSFKNAESFAISKDKLRGLRYGCEGDGGGRI
jgi:hypothetical protein